MAPRKLAAIVTVLGASTPAYADDVSYQLETAVASNYIVRGIAQYSTRKIPCNQSIAMVRLEHVGSGSLTLLGFGAVALDDYDQQPGNSLELDVTATYADTAGPIAFSTGYATYLYPNHADGAPTDGAHELFATASYDNPFVVPTAGAYVEFVRQQGVYLMLGGTHDFHEGKWTFSPTVSVGGATYRKYLGGTQSAAPHLNDATAAFVARHDFSAGIYAAARVSYSLRGTPSELLPMGMDWGFDGRSSIYGSFAVGVAR